MTKLSKYAISTSDGHDEDWYYYETEVQYKEALDLFIKTESDVHGYILNASNEYEVIDSYCETY